MKGRLWKIWIFLTCTGVFALGVDKGELEGGAKGRYVEFQNYTGVHAKIDSAESIKDIGRLLGESIKAGRKDAGDKGKYYVVHAYSKEEEGKLSADIMFLGKNAGVDHIKNLRRIISAYLNRAYGYSEKDSDTLSVFITVYNAVYRADLPYFKSRYTAEVTSYLSGKNCGLSSSYIEWAGKSEIVIPLTASSSPVSAIDTSLISSKEVTSRMKDKEGIDTRKGMVDLKEKEALEARERAKKAKEELGEVAREVKRSEEAARKAREAVDEAKSAVEKAKERAREAERKTGEARKEESLKQEKAQELEKKALEAEKAAKSGGEAEKKAAEIARKEANAANKEAKEASIARERAEKEEIEAKREEEQTGRDLKKAEEKRDESEEKLKDAKERKAAKEEEVKKEEAFGEKKESEADTERKDIARDQMKLIEEKERLGEVFTALKLTDEANLLSSIVKVSSKTGKESAHSEIESIRGRKMYKIGGSIFVIAGEKSAKSAVRLVEIDAETLRMKNESEAFVSERSDLVEEGGFFYCVIEEEGGFYAAKFTQDLKLVSKSTFRVKSSTPITMDKGALAVTDEGGKAVLLEKNGMKEIKN